MTTLGRELARRNHRVTVVAREDGRAKTAAAEARVCGHWRGGVSPRRHESASRRPGADERHYGDALHGQAAAPRRDRHAPRRARRHPRARNRCIDRGSGHPRGRRGGGPARAALRECLQRPRIEPRSRQPAGHPCLALRSGLLGTNPQRLGQRGAPLGGASPHGGNQCASEAAWAAAQERNRRRFDAGADRAAAGVFSIFRGPGCPNAFTIQAPGTIPRAAMPSHSHGSGSTGGL